MPANFYQKLLRAARERPEHVDYEIGSASEEILVRSDEDYKYRDWFNRIERDVSEELIPWTDDRADVFSYGPILGPHEICDPYGAGFFQKIGLAMAEYYSRLLENLPEETTVTKDYWIDDKGNITDTLYYAVNGDAKKIKEDYREWSRSQKCNYIRQKVITKDDYTWQDEMELCFRPFSSSNYFSGEARFVDVKDFDEGSPEYFDHRLLFIGENGAKWHAIKNHRGITVYNWNILNYDPNVEKPDNAVERIEVRDRQNDGDVNSVEGSMAWGGDLYIKKRSPYTEGMLEFFSSILKKQHFDEYYYKTDAMPTDVYFEKGDKVHKGDLLFRYATEKGAREFVAEEDGEVDNIDEGCSSYKWWMMKIKADDGNGWFSWF